MEDNIVTLIVGLTGIVSTLIASLVGAFFISKERHQSLRHALFERQFDLVTRITFRMGWIRNFIVILSADDNTHHELAVLDLHESISKFSELVDEGAAFLPVELWIETNRLLSELSSFSDEFEKQGDQPKAKLDSLVIDMGKISLMIRAIVGADELTSVNLDLINKRDILEKLSEIQSADLLGKS